MLSQHSQKNWGSHSAQSRYQRCGWISLQKIPAADIWVFPAEAPDIQSGRHVAFLLHSLNFWPTGSMSIRKEWLFYAIKFWVFFMQQWIAGTIKPNCGSLAYQPEACEFHPAGQWFANSGPQSFLSSRGWGAWGVGGGVRKGREDRVLGVYSHLLLPHVSALYSRFPSKLLLTGYHVKNNRIQILVSINQYIRTYIYINL